tara:strand:- start:382 stop:702 length:321 start_codon:yes stop_codon:yes gene_type:complete
MPLTFFYSTQAPTPKVEKKKGGFDCTHAHGARCTQGSNWFPSSRKASTRVIESEIKKVRACVAFFEEYKDSLTSVDDRAELAASIQNDKMYIEGLNEIKPSNCTIS